MLGTPQQKSGEIPETPTTGKHHDNTEKQDEFHIESKNDIPEHENTQMRTSADDVSVWQAMKRYKFVCGIAMAAAFSSSLDGYRELASVPTFQSGANDERRDHS